MPHRKPLYFALALATALQAALPSLDDTTTYHRQDFDGLISTGTADFTELPPGWSAVETGTNANTSLAADSGTSNAGNTYSYGSKGSTDRALGLLASGTLTGRIEFRIVNASGKTVDSVQVRVSTEQWRLGGSTTDSMTASVRTNRTGPTLVPALTIRVDQGSTNTRNPDANANAVVLESKFAVDLAPSDTLVLVWADTNAAGNDDAWAIDDFQLRFAHFGEPDTTPPGPGPDPLVRTLAIHQIQGPGASSPWLDSTVSFTGIVTADLLAANQLKGIHVQTADADKDADEKTSEGIFVYVGSNTLDIDVGDSVRVTGKVAEYSGLTEIVSPKIDVLSWGRTLPVAVDLVLPLDSLGAAERWEGMLVRLPQRLVVTGNYTLGRYGEMIVSPRRQMAPTQVAAPGVAAMAAMHADNLSRLTINDGSTVQNPPSVPYPTCGLSASNTLRTGSLVEGLVGVLDYGFGSWTLQPTQEPAFSHANPRTPEPPEPSGDVRVASFNVLNYFTTLGTAAKCGPTRSLECRGANDSVEFRRQKSKIVSAILRLEADVVGLLEIENHPTDSALSNLVQALNDASAPGTWMHIPTGPIGTDAIKVAMIYKPSRVVPTDSVAKLTSAVDPGFVDNLNRIPMAQTFRHPTKDLRFTVVINHLKSKGSACAGDPDIGDGQGNCNQVRTRAASALAKWVNSRPTGTSSPNALLVGDFNAYAKEDPIATLVGSGFVNLGVRDEGDSAYSYQFGNAFGMLDHAFATPGLAANARAKHWAINADEPVALGYNREFKSAEQLESYYAPDPYGSSDHDPVLVDIDYIPTATNSASVAHRFSISRTRQGLSLDAGAGAAGIAYQILSPSGRLLARGTLDERGTAEFRLDARGTAYLAFGQTDLSNRSRLIVLP